jgi:hypothetical protein
MQKRDNDNTSPEALAEFSRLCLSEGHDWIDGRCHFRQSSMAKNPTFIVALVLAVIGLIAISAGLGYAFRAQFRRLVAQKHGTRDVPMEMDAVGSLRGSRSSRSGSFAQRYSRNV